MGLTNKFSTEHMFKKQNDLSFDLLSITETFKKYYFSLGENLVLKLPKPPNSFGIQSVNNYYQKCNLKDRILFAKIESYKVFKLLKTFDESKASGINDLLEIFLKDSASLLVMPITQIRNLSISFGKFPHASKIENWSHYFKKYTKTDPKN